MKRTIALAALAAMIATPTVGHAAKPKRIERKVVLKYQGFCDAGINGLHGGPTTCPTAAEQMVTIKKGEAYLKFAAVDSRGRTIGLRYYNDADFGGTVQTFCGKTSKAQKVKYKATMAVKTAIDPNCGGVPTNGTLTITISNLP